MKVRRRIAVFAAAVTLLFAMTATLPAVAASPTAVPPPTAGAIGATYRALGGAKGQLGVAITAERCGLVSAGCYQKFVGGYIYWTSATKAQSVWGGIGTKWAQMGYENGFSGYPTSAESCSATAPRRCTQQFQGASITWTSGAGISVAPRAGTIGVVVNKKRPNTPLSQVPPDLVQVSSQYMRREAAGQLNKLLAAARSANVAMTTVSGYRSYAAQLSLYNSYVAQYGRATADTISARAGFSEHQTGLAMDIGNPNAACALQACFASTPAGKYAASNAWKYGFIIRYPQGYTSVTGYTYEPWHLRYVGVKAATDMRNGNYKTLEQYFGMAAAPNY